MERKMNSSVGLGRRWRHRWVGREYLETTLYKPPGKLDAGLCLAFSSALTSVDVPSPVSMTTEGKITITLIKKTSNIHCNVFFYSLVSYLVDSDIETSHSIEFLSIFFSIPSFDSTLRPLLHRMDAKDPKAHSGLLLLGSLLTLAFDALHITLRPRRRGLIGPTSLPHATLNHSYPS